uniref:Aminotransferase-like plant mobile domain-containing protein n=1 Tax=Fagus sylvatica TaxID=28930 RepID=A0A2N9GEU9_FAGSY
MASSSSAPVGPPLQPGSGEELEAPPLVPAASTEAMVDAPMAPPPIPGESVPAAPSSVSGEAEDLREGFAAPLIDPWYTSSPLFPPKSVDFSYPVEDWDWTVSGVEPMVDQAWVPNLDEISELLIQKGDLQATPINFDFLCAASKDWSHWVDREILDSDFWDNLVDAEVHWSILISRSCNMFRDTEALRELLRRWCPSTHTFFFSWGELTPTLEDVANHWMLPILGEHSLSNIKLSAAEEETAAVLKKQSSTRLSGWPSFSSSTTRMLQSAVLPSYYIGYIAGDSCYILSAAFNTSALQTFFWEHSISYIFAARDRSAAWGRFSDLPQKFLDHFPSFRDNLPLVYRWVGLKPRDHDLVDALDYEENVLFRPYGDDHPGFTCAPIFRKFYQPSPLIRDLKVDDYRSLSYLSTVNPGFLPIMSATGVSFIPYCPQRPSSRVVHFARWGGETTRVLIPGGHRLGFNTPSMGAYWQRFTQSMVDFVIAGRSDKTPMSVHRKPLVSNPYLTPPSQSAISYANSQKLGFAEWDSVRGGWIAYTIHLPDGWRSSVNVVEDRLIMLSKRGKGSKRDAPADPAFEKTPKKPAPTVSSSKKAPSKKAKAVKQGKSPLLVLSAAEESTTALVQGSTKSAVAPPKRKTRAGKESKSTPSESVESTVAPSKPKSASPPKQTVKKSAASRPPRGQKKASISSSTDEEEPSAVSTPSPPKKKKFTAPLFPLGAAGRTRSKSGPRVARGSGGSGGDMVVVEDSDVAEDDVVASPSEEDAPRAAAVDQTEDLGKSAADSPGIGVESTGEDHSSSSGSFFDSVPDSVPEEQIVSAESTADDDTPEDDDSSMGLADPMEEDLAIVPHVSQGCDDDSTVDADADPISFSVPQTVLNQQNYSLRAVPAGGFVISASHLTSETPPVVGGALMLEEPRAQGLVESEPVVDLAVGATDHDVPAGDTGASAADTLAGVDDAVHVSEEIDEVGITGEVTVVSPPRRPTIEAGSSVGVGGLSGEVAAFLREFDARAPNPHPEQFFWSFNGPLVPFGDFWVPNDCSPYLSRLSAGHSDFTKGFKLSIGLGGPMMSLLGSVLAAMDESSLEDVTKTQILAWRSVIQDLMDVGFDLGFMMERLRQMAQCLFGKRLADEIKALQHQIALLQDSLAELTAYQDAMMSTGGVVPRSERGGSFLDSLLD